MKYFLVLLALVSSLVTAAPLSERAIANMMAQSESVMSRGLCIVANSKEKTGTVTIVLPAPIGARTIKREDYNWLRETGYAKGSSGLFLMTERIQEACTADGTGDRCLAARALWKAGG